MRAIVHDRNGSSTVLRLVDRPVPEPAAGEVVVAIRVSGVNPTDWKTRAGKSRTMTTGVEHTPNQDGAGVISAVGAGVDPARIGQRVWVYQAAWQRPAGGTAKEYLALPADQAVPLPDEAGYDLGAALGIPAMTAHRCLTVAEGGPTTLRPGALAGRTVLVSGGAGAVGHAAIGLARWAGARVIATVSGRAKAELAEAAGAHHVVRYTEPGCADRIRELAPDGIDQFVEVAPGVNVELDVAVARQAATVAFYASDAVGSLPIWAGMTKNLRWQAVLIYTVPTAALHDAARDVTAAVADGALRVGAEAGLPLHRFGLEDTAAAHDAVEAGAVGKVLIDVRPA